MRVRGFGNCFSKVDLLMESEGTQLFSRKWGVYITSSHAVSLHTLKVQLGRLLNMSTQPPTSFETRSSTCCLENYLLGHPDNAPSSFGFWYDTKCKFYFIMS